MRQSQPVEGYVVLKVPQAGSTIDIFVENTGHLKKPIAAANQTVGGANSSLFPPLQPQFPAPLLKLAPKHQW